MGKPVTRCTSPPPTSFPVSFYGAVSPPSHPSLMQPGPPQTSFLVFVVPKWGPFPGAGEMTTVLWLPLAATSGVGPLPHPHSSSPRGCQTPRPQLERRAGHTGGPSFVAGGQRLWSVTPSPPWVSPGAPSLSGLAYSSIHCTPAPHVCSVQDRICLQP